MIFNQKIIKNLVIIFNTRLSNYSWFNLGEAQYLFAKDKKQLIEFFNENKK